MNTKTTRKKGHDENIAIEGHSYLCRFRQDARGAYCVTCLALPSVFAYGTDLAGARLAMAHEIEGFISDRERRYEEDAWSVLQYRL